MIMEWKKFHGVAKESVEDSSSLGRTSTGVVQ